MAIIDDLNQGIKEAMIKKEALRLDTLRMMKSKIMAVEARGNVPEPEAIKLFKTYLGNLQEALEHAKNSNRSEMIEKLEKEMAVVQEFLPQALSLEEAKKIVQQAIEQSGAKTKKELGLAMKAIRSISSSIDGKQAKDLLDQLLSD